jgi:hypothetical protein
MIDAHTVILSYLYDSSFGRLPFAQDPDNLTRFSIPPQAERSSNYQEQGADNGKGNSYKGCDSPSGEYSSHKGKDQAEPNGQ